jgi:hypothetical protein
VKVRDRNEVLDLFCLNIAAGYRNDVLGSRLRERELERLQAQLEPEIDLFNSKAPAPEKKVEALPQPPDPFAAVKPAAQPARPASSSLAKSDWSSRL